MTREPPQSPEAEREVLNSLILDGSALALVREIGLEATHFYQERNRVIYRSIERLAGRGSSAELPLLTEELRSSGELEDAGNVAYLTGLMVEAQSAGSLVEHYARAVVESAKRRELIAGLAQASQAAYGDEESFERVAGRVRDLLHTSLQGEELRVTSDWAGAEPEPRHWLCPGWLPLNRVALLTGPGSAGKSLLALHLAVTVASGQGVSGGEKTKLLPIMGGLRNGGNGGPAVDPAHTGPVVMLGWEDEAGEVARRLRLLPSGATSRRLPSELHYVDLAGRGPLWAPREGGHRDSGLTLTRAGAQLEGLLAEVEPVLIVIDPAAGAYGGNENDRAAVRSFLAYLNDLGAETGAAVLVVAHPPKGQEAEVYSGSTDWRNGVRALWTLGVRDVAGWELGEGKGAARGYALELDKSNYSRAGARAWLRFRVDSEPDGTARGLYWEEASAGDSAREYHRFRGWAAPRQKQGGTKRGNVPQEALDVV